MMLFNNLFSKNNLIIFSFFLFGIIHWFFFFYFVDYYQYKGHEFSRSSDFDNVKEIYFSDDLDKFVYRTPISLQKLIDNDNYYKRDVSLFKLLLEKKNLSKLFQKKIFLLHDWVNEHNASGVVKYSIQNNIIPYHAPFSMGAGPSGDRFLAGPINVISPQIILLKYLDTQTFAFINFLLMYLVGFIGCLLFKYKFKISNLPFFILFLFYNFNGYFVEKITAYGPSSMGYFLLPYCIYFLFVIVNLNNKNKGINNKNKVNQINYGILFGLFHSLILYQGSLHLYTISLTFLLFWFIFNFKNYLFLFFSLCISFSLSAIKLLPAAFTYGTEGNFHYWEGGGYASFISLIEGMIVLKNMFYYPAFSQWETSLYISFFGLIILFIFGFINYLNNLKEGDLYLKSFAIPSLLMLFISFRHFKHLIIPHWVPLLNSESITSRYVIIPFLILTFIAVINLQDYLIRNKQAILNKWLVYLTSFFSFALMMNHSRIWRMHRVDNEYNWHLVLSSIRNKPFYDKGYEDFIFNNYNDIMYIYVFWTGFIISLITAILLVFWFIFKKNIINKLSNL